MLTASVVHLQELLSPQGTALERFMTDYKSMTPDEADLNGAAASMLRLQRTYNL